MSIPFIQILSLGGKFIYVSSVGVLPYDVFIFLVCLNVK